jgi:hypothetical protein
MLDEHRIGRPVSRFVQPLPPLPPPNQAKRHIHPVPLHAQQPGTGKSLLR